MKKNCILLACALSLAGTAFAQQNKPTWGNHVAFGSQTGQSESNARISAGVDGALYAAHLLANNADGVYGWELRKSTDNGATWSTLRFDATTFLNTNQPRLDLYVAGTTVANMKVYVARSWKDNADAAHLRLDQYSSTGVLQETPVNESPDAVTFYQSLSISSDDHDPSSNNVPYAVALTVATRGGMDSVITFASEDGGATWPNRTGLYGTAGYIRSLASAHGTSSQSIFGRVGIAWMETAGGADAYGAIKYMMAYGDDGTHTAGDVYSLPGSLRNPTIALVQNINSATLRGVLLYEKESTNTLQGVWLADTYTGGATDPFSAQAASDVATDPFVLYNATTDNFVLTYEEDNDLRLQKIAAAAPIASQPLTIINNYESIDDANGQARLSYNPGSGDMFSAWSSASVSYVAGTSLNATAISDMAGNAATVSFYPNPATTVINLSCTLKAAATAAFSLTDVTGRVVTTQEVSLQAGSNVLKISLPGVPAGQYTATLRGEGIMYAAPIAVRL